MKLYNIILSSFLFALPCITLGDDVSTVKSFGDWYEEHGQELELEARLMSVDINPEHVATITEMGNWLESCNNIDFEEDSKEHIDQCLFLEKYFYRSRL